MAADIAEKQYEKVALSCEAIGLNVQLTTFVCIAVLR